MTKEKNNIRIIWSVILIKVQVYFRKCKKSSGWPDILFSPAVCSTRFCTWKREKILARCLFHLIFWTGAHWSESFFDIGALKLIHFLAEMGKMPCFGWPVSGNLSNAESVSLMTIGFFTLPGTEYTPPYSIHLREKNQVKSHSKIESFQSEVPEGGSIL